MVLLVTIGTLVSNCITFFTSVSLLTALCALFSQIFEAGTLRCAGNFGFFRRHLDVVGCRAAKLNEFQSKKTRPYICSIIAASDKKYV